MSALTERAATVAEVELADALPRRWRHVRAVAQKAERLGHILPFEDRDALTAAAWLHDVGYAPGIADTGLHALDGARWLRVQGFDERLAALVAYHSCALFEAEERGLEALLLGEFQQEQSLTADTLWYVDMTTGPDGDDLTVLERLSEARARYGPDHVVTRFWARAEATLLEATGRVEAVLTGQPM